MLRATQRAIASNIVRHNQVMEYRKMWRKKNFFFQESTTTASTSSASGARGEKKNSMEKHYKIMIWHGFSALSIVFIGLGGSYGGGRHPSQESRKSSGPSRYLIVYFFIQRVKYLNIFFQGPCQDNIHLTPIPAQALHLFWIMETASLRRGLLT